MRKAIVNHLFFILICFLVWYKGITGPDLIWNMFLALVAYEFSLLAVYTKSKWLVVFPTLAWLAFFPNTFYMLTDIFHMGFVQGGYQANDIVTRFIPFILSILFGVLCGVESWHLIVQRFRLSWPYVYAIVPVLAFVSSFAISIGRFERFNSWDLVRYPLAVVRVLLDTISWQRLPFILGFTLLQILCLLFLENSSKK
ncbi:putative membrane protein [Streptococcus sp. DD10]|uniref:DUF1361 domain-containing protein n=1 Tax=Streptococcus sp. DD10 TaxID=1777878 RepID=UPI0007918CC3|nr:DUF1361 domain-containing protein [Streptococcus sp. DD10]KXT73569.1 putative membrane protein [Streptococcus sp. DD10]